MSQATTHTRAKLTWLLIASVTFGIVYGFASIYSGIALQSAAVQTGDRDCAYRVFLLRDRVLTYIGLPPSFQAAAHPRLLTIFRETQGACRQHSPAEAPMLDRLAIALEQQSQRAAFIRELHASPEFRAYQEPFPWPIFPMTQATPPP